MEHSWTRRQFRLVADSVCEKVEIWRYLAKPYPLVIARLDVQHPLYQGGFRRICGYTTTVEFLITYDVVVEFISYMRDLCSMTCGVIGATIS